MTFKAWAQLGESGNARDLHEHTDEEGDEFQALQTRLACTANTFANMLTKYGPSDPLFITEIL